MKNSICMTILASLCSTIAFAQSDPTVSPANGNIFGVAGSIADTQASVTEPGKTSLLEQLKNAMAAGHSNEEIFALIDDAIASGDIKVPDAMKTTTGEVDHAILLASIFTDETSEQTEEPTQLSEDTNDAEPKPAILTAERGYIVVTGDSLARIAQKFYGDPELYTRIFNANRDQVSLPNKIFVGQRLLIP